jgi:uncharacterized protein (TIGR00255 family)
MFSMTGFGNGEAVGEKYTLNVEIKTVNNRFKDFRFRMGGILSEFEIPVRKKLESKFARGSFDINISYKRNPGFEKAFEIDEAKVKNYINLIQAMAGESLAISPTEFLRSDFYVDEDDSEKKETLKNLLFEALEKACDKLLTAREQEGSKLKETIENHLKEYTLYYDKVVGLKQKYKEEIEGRLKEKFQENLNNIKVDEPRFMQEIIYYLEKLDIDEEINRIKIHIQKLKGILSKGGESGRKIDFLLQEFNRETNTIGSKSGHEEISSSVVEMKVQLEKIREQALNIE